MNFKTCSSFSLLYNFFLLLTDLSLLFFPQMNTFNHQPLGDPQPQATHEVVAELHGAHLFQRTRRTFFLTYKTGVMLKGGYKVGPKTSWKYGYTPEI